jgi:transcriptional antiterminator
VKVTAVKRRLELLKLEGLGFSQPEIVTELSQKHECSRRTVYRDFESRGHWQPELQSVKNHAQVLMRTVNRYEQIYREASVRLLTGTQELTQLGALNIMLKANSKICETAVLPDLFSRLKELEEKARKGVFVK